MAARETTAAIGLDTELVGGTSTGGGAPAGVRSQLWPSICVAAEIEWLETLTEPARIPAATLIFSAKEAFYKCQYPLTREPLGFHDARVELIDWGGGSGSFTIAATRNIAFAAHAVLPMPGRYRFHGPFVSSGLWSRTQRAGSRAVDL